MFVSAAGASEPKGILESVGRIYNHVIEKMGGFAVDGWTSRASIAATSEQPSSAPDDGETR